MRILVTDGDIVMGDLTFEQDAITVGSLPENSICLPGRNVAERHVVFTRNQDRVWFVESTDPSLPTTANGIDLRNRVPFQEGMCIGVDRYRLKCFMHWAMRHDEAAAEHSIEEMALLRRNPLPPGTIVKGHHEEIVLGPGWSDRVGVIAAEVSACPDLRVLMDYTLDMLIKVFGASYVYMGARQRPSGRFEYVEGRTASGSVNDLPKLGQRMVYRSVERSMHLCVVHADSPPVVSAMSVPLLSAAGSLGVLYLDSRTDGQNYKPRHLDLLGAIGGLVSQRLGVVLENAQHLQEEEVRGEIDLVRAVQARVEASRSATWLNFEVATYCRPGAERCSDVIDITKQPNDKAAILLARVRGDRLAAAIAMLEIRAGFRACMLHGDMPQAILKVLNLLVADRLDEGRTDALCLQIDPNSGELIAAAAGQIAPAILSGDGSARPLLKEPAPPLGTDRKANFRAHKSRLATGEILMLTSPGLEQARNRDGRPLTRQMVIDTLKDVYGQTLHQTLEELVTELAPYLPDGTPADDLTIALAARSK